MLGLHHATEKGLVEAYTELNNAIQQLIHQVNDDYDDQLLWGTDSGEKESEQAMWEFHIDRQMNGANGELVSIYQTPYMKRPSQPFFPGICGFDPR